MIQIKKTTFVVALLTLSACGWVQQQLPPPRSNVRDILMDAALAQVGRPYRYQGADPSGFDASGLVRYVFAQTGIELPHSTEGQHAQGLVIPFSAIQRGDLLFYQLEKSAYPQMHVGIYVGHSRMVHVAGKDRVQMVEIDTPYWRRHFMDAVSHLP